MTREIRFSCHGNPSVEKTVLVEIGKTRKFADKSRSCCMSMSISKDIEVKH
jgi:hypothetical protein